MKNFETGCGGANLEPCSFLTTSRTQTQQNKAKVESDRPDRMLGNSSGLCICLITYYMHAVVHAHTCGFTHTHTHTCAGMCKEINSNLMTNGKLPKPRPLEQPDQRLVFWFVERQCYSRLCNLLSLSKAVFTCDVCPLYLLFCLCYHRGESPLWLASWAHFDERVVKFSRRSMDFEKIPQPSLLEFSAYTPILLC